MGDRTELQQEIVALCEKNPDATDKEIAQKAGCSQSYVSETRQKYVKGLPDDSLAKAVINVLIVIGGLLLVLYLAGARPG